MKQSEFGHPRPAAGLLYLKRLPALALVLAMLPLLASADSIPFPRRKALHPGHIPGPVSHAMVLKRLEATNHLELAIALPLRNPQALDQLLKDLYNPASPHYHHFLTCPQFTEQFGPTEAQYAQVIAFAQTNGLTVSKTHPNRLLLDVSGQAGNIERAFAVRLRVYAHPTENREFFAPDIEPSVEAGLPILGVSGLDDSVLPRRLSSKATPLTAQAQVQKYATGSGPSGLFLGDDFRNAYVPGVSLTGTGQAVALIEFGPYFTKDVTTYESYANRTNIAVTNVLVKGFNGTPSNGYDDSEEALDIQMVMSMAPGATIMVYEANSGTDMFNQIATDNRAKQIGCSWGWSPMDAILNQIFQQMAAQGQSVFVASGDSGALAGPITPPSDNPYVTVVGGTSLTTSGPGGAWGSETTWSHSSGGISTSYSIPSWQTTVSMATCKGSTNARNVPDVAMQADTTIFTVVKNGQTSAIGGTSAAAPLWAGLMALINQQASANGRAPIGFLNPSLYTLCQSSDYSACFHDITTGNTFSTANPRLFSAVSGYDLCTGWGSPKGDQLISYLAGPSDALQINPGTGFSLRYTNGQPFSVSSVDFTVANNGSSSLNWTAASTVQWLSLSTSGGTLAASTNTGVTASLNASVATNLVGGTYYANVWFTNTSSGLAQSRLFTLTVLPHNLPPTFTLKTNQIIIPENAGSISLSSFLTGISAGAGESTQSVTLGVTTATNAITNVAFSKLPAFTVSGANASLSFRAASNSFGTNLVTIILKDNGSTANGGINALTNYLTLGVYWVNQPPQVRGVTNQTVLENAAPATNLITVYDVDSASSLLTLSAASSNPSVATAALIQTNALNGTNAAVFTLVMTPQTNANGKTTVTLVASDGANQLTNRLTFTVTSVNQQPSFNLSTNLIIAGENAGTVTVPLFLTRLHTGPTNETSQTLSFTLITYTNSSTNATFSALPSCKQSGTNATLSFKPATNSFGTNPVTIIMKDSGGTANGGVNAWTNSFTVGVYWINQPPRVRGATNRSVLENSGPVTTIVTVYDVDSASSNLTLTALCSNTNLATFVPVQTNQLAGTNAADFTFQITPQTNANGKATITLIAGDGANSTTNQFTLTVTAVNQPPQFILSTNWLQAQENAASLTFSNFLTGVRAGPTNEVSQSLSFTLLYATNSSTNVQFSSKPSFKLIGTNAHLSFRTATNSFGTNTITVILKDGGSTANGGINVFSNSFVLAVPWTKYTPVIYGLKDVSLLENKTNRVSVPFTIWDPTFTNFTVAATSSDTNMTTVSVTASNTAGLLTLYPCTNVYGSNVLITVAVDDGYGAGGTNFATFKFSLAFVNQLPSFSLAVTNVAVHLYQQPVTIPGAVTNISSGPASETNQAVSFIVKASNTKLFQVQPAISTNGTLTFTPQAMGGSTVLSVSAHDNGGTKNSGHDTSPAQTINLTIPDNPFLALRGTYSGLFYQTNALDNNSSGYLQIKLATNGQFSGFLLCASASNQFSGQFAPLSPTNFLNVSNTTFALSLGLDLTSGANTISGSVSNSSAGWDSPLLTFLNTFSSQSPAPFAGAYLATIPSSLAPSLGPSGDCVLSLIVSNNGGVSLSGYLADDTPVKQQSTLSTDGHFPLYIGLGATGSLSGWLGFTSAGTSRFSADSQVVWIEATNRLFPNGFTNSSIALASGYQTNQSALFPAQSGTVILSGGQLTSAITNQITLTNNTIVVDASATNRLRLSIYRPTGQIFGGFYDATGQSNEINAVILQSTNAARGYFINQNQCGSFLLQGN